MTLSFNQTFLKIYSSLFAKKIGSDEYGNLYFSNNKKKPTNNYRESRWIIYEGEVEASKVPQEWNAWLHHVTKDAPRKFTRKPKWVKRHKPNLTGTVKANKVKDVRVKNKINDIYSKWNPND